MHYPLLLLVSVNRKINVVMCTVVTIQGAEKEKRRVSRRSETRGMNGRYSHLDGLKLQIRK